jgi:hypothetical protein
MLKAFSWKCSRISILEVEAVPQSCVPLVQIEVKVYFRPTDSRTVSLGVGFLPKLRQTSTRVQTQSGRYFSCLFELRIFSPNPELFYSHSILRAFDSVMHYGSLKLGSKFAVRAN